MSMRTVSVGPNELIGDLSAPEGCPLWCLGMRTELQHILHQHDIDHQSLEWLTERFLDAEGWKKVVDKHDRPFPDYTSFCIAPYPFGLGRQREEIDRIITEGKERTLQEKARDLLPFMEPHRPAKEEAEQGEAEKGINDTLPPQPSQKGQNTQENIIRRLKRDAPEIAEALARGEYKSARAAALAAGIVKPVVQLSHKVQTAMQQIIAVYGVEFAKEQAMLVLESLGLTAEDRTRLAVIHEATNDDGETLA